jgi:hypothetical protein
VPILSSLLEKMNRGAPPPGTGCPAGKVSKKNECSFFLEF